MKRLHVAQLNLPLAASWERRWGWGYIKQDKTKAFQLIYQLFALCVRRVHVFIDRCLGKIIKTGWMEKITNQEVWRRAEQWSAEEEIRTRGWGWLGHTWRKENNSNLKNPLDLNQQGKITRRRARHPWRWFREGGGKRSGKSWREIKIAQDRKQLKAFVGGLYPGRGR